MSTLSSGNPDPVDNRGGSYERECPICGVPQGSVPKHIRRDHEWNP
jgi:hypothetical protein